MSKLYVPIYNNENCVIVYDSNTIRRFDNNPTINNEINFTDYFINSHYITKRGKTTFINNDDLPVCISINDLTTDFYYRNDLSDIFVVFFILSIICIYFPIKIFSRIFGRWLRV